ncbi:MULTISPECIES: four helix bundle protein [Chryseobacterium]|uniref:Four helix bundle protein n=1 Tax=Chryseobacterium muglaense TaxID=2893752 RepID=A0ABR8M2B7_9FLAO|nr:MULTISPECIES: four helix bundle protein [Chryseobacterium]MBD3904746.1 four helix bundle protein [Chryseobacterium muglaense]MBO6185975.1 four helix bundle protein [Chryseobacterium sp.]
MKENIIQQKSYEFALKSITLYKKIIAESKEYVLSKQFLRSSTSIGANIEETIGAQSDKDFLSKISIAYKEARETHYWIRLLKDSHYINHDDAMEMLDLCDEILRIIGKIQITIKNRNS